MHVLNYKEHMDNNKVGVETGKEAGRAGVGESGGGKRQKTVLEQKFKKKIKKRKSKYQQM